MLLDFLSGGHIHVKAIHHRASTAGHRLAPAHQSFATLRLLFNLIFYLCFRTFKRWRKFCSLADGELKTSWFVESFSAHVACSSLLHYFDCIGGALHSSPTIFKPCPFSASPQPRLPRRWPVLNSLCLFASLRLLGVLRLFACILDDLGSDSAHIMRSGMSAEATKRSP